MNNTVCAAFWKHTNIRSGDRIFPCCRYKTPIANFDGNLDNILYSPEYESIRTQVLNGEKLSGCDKCYLEESLGKQSLRQQFNNQYDIETITLKNLEIGFDNICNLTCDGCWSEWSSAWGDKVNPLSKKLNVVHTSEINNIPNTIEDITFLGGEPLMTNRHIKFLERIKNLCNINLTYYTNGTFLLDKRTIHVLNKAKHVKFILSIDAIGDLNDKVRSGSSWEDILEFIAQIQKLKFELAVHSVVHKNNWHGFTELADYVNSLKVNWTIGMLTYPTSLSIIGSDHAEEISKFFANLQIPHKQYILNFINNENN